MKVINIKKILNSYQIFLIIMEAKMKILKKIVSFTTIIFLMSATLTDYNKKVVSIVSAETKPSKVSVFLLDFTDDFISEIR